jgi:hypothetical protein
VTGQVIVRAIVGGERDPRKLAELSHPRIRASRGEMAQSLEGNWRQELIFVLQQEIEMYDTYQRRVAEEVKRTSARSTAACVANSAPQKPSPRWLIGSLDCYRMLKYGQQYVDKGAEYYERRNRQQQIEFVRKKAAQLGLQVTPAHI